MAERTEKILDIKVNYSDAAVQIAQYKNLLDSLKKTEKELSEAVKEAGKQEKEMATLYKEGYTTAEQMRQATQARVEAEVRYTQAMVEAKVERKNYNEIISDTVKAMRNQQIQEQEAEGSLKSLRAELSILTKEYDSLSEAERQSASGTELRDKINSVTEVLKVNEEATGRYYRNVGNYENAILDAFNKLNPKLEEARQKYIALLQSEGAQSEATKQAKEAMEGLQNTIVKLDSVQKDLNGTLLGFVTGGNSMIAKMMQMTTGMGSLSNAFTVGKAAVAAFGKQLLILLANPVVLILAGIAAAVMAVSKALQSSEALTNRWKVALAPLNGILDVLMNLLTAAVTRILSIVEAGGKLLMWVANMLQQVPALSGVIGDLNEKMQENIEIEKMRQEIIEKGRELTVKQAKDELEIAKLRAAANDKENNTAEERKKSLEAALKIEEDLVAERKELAEMKLKELEREAALTENDAAMNDKLKEAEAEVYNVEKELFEFRRSANRQISTLNTEIANDEKAAAKQAKKTAEDRAKKIKEAKQKEVEEVRKAEDELLKLVKDNQERLRQQTIYTYERQIEDLKKRLEEEKTLTITAKNAILSQIRSLEAQEQEELNKLSDDALQEQIQTRQRIISYELDAVKKGSEEELALKREQLEKERDLLLSNTEITEEERDAIRASWMAKDDELQRQHNDDLLKRQEEAMRIRIESEIVQIQEGSLERLEAEKEALALRLETLQQYEGESIEAFNKRKIDLQVEYNDKKKELADKEVDIEYAKAAAIADTYGTISNAISELSGENKKAVAAAKVLALAEVAINQGVAMSRAIKNAGKELTVWQQIAAMAAGISAIVISTASAVKAIRSATVDTEKTKGYATGGRVTGSGSGTSDSIPARLSNGESVLTARATSMFAPILSAFNTMGGGVPIQGTQTAEQTIGEEMLARAVAKGVQSMPSPVVSVEEINNVGNRVKVLERLGDV